MDEASQYSTGCVLDETSGVGPNEHTGDEPGMNAGSDIPSETAGSTDRAYGDRLTAESCVAKPWLCDDSYAN